LPFINYRVFLFICLCLSPLLCLFLELFFVRLLLGMFFMLFILRCSLCFVIMAGPKRDMHRYRSRVMEESVKKFCSQYDISLLLEVQIPDPMENISHRPDDFIGVYMKHFSDMIFPKGLNRWRICSDMKFTTCFTVIAANGFTSGHFVK
jgi:hypothetical protein